MTVRSLNYGEILSIAYAFKHEKTSITELATHYQRSRRTIIRALEDQGVDPGIKRRKPVAKPVPVVLPKPIPTKTPWWKRFFQNMGFIYTGRWPGPRA